MGQACQQEMQARKTVGGNQQALSRQTLGGQGADQAVERGGDILGRGERAVWCFDQPDPGIDEALPRGERRRPLAIVFRRPDAGEVRQRGSASSMPGCGSHPLGFAGESADRVVEKIAGHLLSRSLVIM
ncbi:hypothetical protein [Mesorhizobium sp.]|uniref:hypothetical protein n=1 Tax=Mesorhizobium sp. TaxID=1871066 RepID=UPI0025E5A9C4|nr:hypothetical protein [Mesorhizobium sp.]